MFELKPDFDQVLERYEAWWDCQIIDRPLVSISFPKPASEQVSVPESNHASFRDRWLDTDFVVERTNALLSNTVHFADALPVAYPNLGPEIFSAFYGCPLHFGDHTVWSEPILKDWDEEEAAGLNIDENGFYYSKIVELYDALVEAGKDKFIVGYTDFHPGGDAIAAFRDPQRLCIDTLERPGEIKKLCDRITDDFLRVFDQFHRKIIADGMHSSTWLPAACKGKFHVPSNDFSCMISTEMFEELFVPGIIRECKHMDRNIYHLDGPQALRHLDLLLAIPEIHAIQWVPGAGQEHWGNWIEVYQKIQNAGKALCLNLPAGDIEKFCELFRPEGVWLTLTGIPDEDVADAVLKRIAKWTDQGKVTN